MRIRSWLSLVFNAIRIQSNRHRRRWLSNLHAASRRSARRLLAAAVLTPMLMATANGDGPLFPDTGTFFSAVDQPASVTTGDFNGDGVTDLATANFNSNDVSVLLGIDESKILFEFFKKSLDMLSS